MKVIGITGPTGAGKTTALNALRSLGGQIIDADAVYHDLTRSSPALRAELEARIGPVYNGETPGEADHGPGGNFRGLCPDAGGGPEAQCLVPGAL